ncbi:peptide ABC transporter substrate-binding protein [Propylenella binzhouense]|uniref:Peptide ABC transporter substrate-binding protein n=1 Tax=Propylenella binzhouense TaxID=2555902 RepID=A0A964T3D9_9HYPH|nr:peptide ABC transporter substrate-binding protein [Propylenella binzhouense]MYZ47207.1 peptide ABC transporter substrate-binding protein [Propylenella binzhouense]
MRHHLLKPLAGLALAVLMTSAASAEVVYTRGNDADPETLDQHKTSTISEANVLRDMYEGLVVYDAKAKVVPGVAESWTVSDDGLTYTFKLRTDAKWSNGDPVTAGDFVFSLQRIMNAETGAKYANILYPIKNAEKLNKGEAKPEELGVRAVDDHTLEIVLENPTPYFLELLTHQTGLPVNKAAVEKFGTDFVKAGNIVTNGAYTLQEFTPNDKIVLVKNKEFHDAADVKIDKVVFIPFEDRSACLRRFEAGEVQSCSDIPAEQMDYVKEKLGDQVHIAPYLGTYYYAIKADKDKFSDLRVRRALSMAIDREFVADEIWAGAMLPAYSFVPPGIGNYGEPAYADYKDMDQLDREDEAKKLLEEAGYGPGKPLRVEIRYNTGENHKNTATAIADMWKTIGVETSFVNVDGATHYAYLRDKGDFDIARAGWIGDYSDPQNFLFLVESDNTGFNYANYKNPEYDKLMDEAATTTDLQKRAGILKQAEAIFMRDLPYIPLLYYSSLSLVSDRLTGWEDNIQNAHATRWMSLSQ